MPGRGLPAQRIAESDEIVLADLVHRAGRHILQREGAVGGTDKAADLEAEMLEDAADLAILAFAQPHLDPAVAAGAPLQIGVDSAVANALDLDAVDQVFQLRLADLAEDAGAVAALDAGGGQLELALELAVRGEQQQPLRVHVQPADRHHPRQAFRQPVVDRGAALGVMLGGEQAAGLVVAEQAGRGGRCDRLAVDRDAVQRSEQSRRLLDRLAGDRDPAILDHPLDLAARGYPSAGEQFSDALTLSGRLFDAHLSHSSAVRTIFAPARLRHAAPAPRYAVKASSTGRGRPYMLFGRRERRINRIMVVEDEPLVAFDNESMLQDAGYVVVATVDNYVDAAEAMARDALDLILTDISLAGEGSGVDVARAASALGIPVLFVTGNCTAEAKALAVGCLAKPYSERVLLGTLAAVDEHLQGRAPKRVPEELTLYVSA